MQVRVSDCVEALRRELARSAGEFPALVSNTDAVEDLCEGATRGGDVERLGDVKKWLSWLRYFYVELDESDYMKAAVYALHLAPHIVATDYGTARQRDLAQVWTDALRGFLGEVAFAKWLKAKFGTFVELDYRRGRLEEFLPSDIKRVDGKEPGLKVSVKTTKLSGIWLDVPYKQALHSDVFVMVRVGVTREHFVAFLKKISVIKEKFLSWARQTNVLAEEDAKRLWDEIPDFKNIPAVIVGFLMKSADLKICYRSGALDTACLIDAVARVKRSKRGMKLHVDRYMGFWDAENLNIRCRLAEILRGKGIEADPSMPVEFEGIGEFTKVLHFIASSGYLVKTVDEWKRLVDALKQS